MKRNNKPLWKMLVMGLMLPALIVGLAIAAVGKQNSLSRQEPEKIQSSGSLENRPDPGRETGKPVRPIQDKPISTTPAQEPTTGVDISVMMDGELTQMDLNTYLLGVLLAEVPASFPMEALKAQAVASRTYALSCAEGRGNHKEGYICTSSCCQSYIAPEQYIAQGGTEEGINRMRTAVNETGYQVVTYAGRLITATYFSCSGGRTESALAVFGADHPYLQPVESPGEEGAYVYSHSIQYTKEGLEDFLGMELIGPPESWFTDVRYTDGGGVEQIYICGVRFTGVQLRSLLHLRSTVFTIEISEGIISFHTLGFGHRVGMSQFGAEAMAKAGKTYDQILVHYYTGTSIAQYAS